MLNNQLRRQLLERHKQSGFPGSIIDVYKAYEQGVDIISNFEQQQMQQPQVAQTPQQQQAGLRPFHQAGNTSQSMVFPNVPPNTPFNTVGMKAPINIEKYDKQGHLVKSYENVPPGIENLPTGPSEGTVIETPANMQSGGQLAPIYTNNPKDSRLQAYNDSLHLYNKTRDIENPKYYDDGNPSWYGFRGTHAEAENFAIRNNIDYYFEYYRTGRFPGEIQPIDAKDWGEGMDYPIYKKPVQPVIYRELAPLTPRTAPSNIYPSKELRESNVALPKPSGRKAQPIMRADFSKGIARQGQYQIGERYWDDDKKRWKEDRWSPEEIKESKRIAIEGLKPPGEYIGKFEFGYGGKRKYQSGNSPEFMYGDWREVSREIDPITRELVITEQRDGSRNLQYNRQGLTWEEGYNKWLARGNKGTIEDFRRSAEKWKQKQSKTEYDSQNRTRRIGQETNTPPTNLYPIPTLSPSPISQNYQDNNSLEDQSNTKPLIRVRPQTPFLNQQSYISNQPYFTPEQLGEERMESGADVGNILPSANVQSIYELDTRSNTGLRENERAKTTFREDTNITRSDGTSSRLRNKQVDRTRPGKENKIKGKTIYEEFDADGNRIIRNVDRFKQGGIKEFKYPRYPKKVSYNNKRSN